MKWDSVSYRTGSDYLVVAVAVAVVVGGEGDDRIGIWVGRELLCSVAVSFDTQIPVNLCFVAVDLKLFWY